MFVYPVKSLLTTSLPDPNPSDLASRPVIFERLQHIEDESGHHVVTGRGGELKRCEDEPIRSPCAVQAFGALIAVEEVDDTLIVRRVSENSAQLLGLSPQELFSLECFTDILADPQASLLWDNIEIVSNLDPARSDDLEAKVLIFLLSGLGAAIDAADPSQGKLPWICWCSIHRSPGSNSRLIILELEPETDLLNPVHPPPAYIPESECVDSPESSSSGTDTSERTLVASIPATYDPTTSMDRLQGEDGWTLRVEDILESTTSRAKPMAALEAMRRAPRRPLLTRSASSRRQRNPHIPSPNIGMMDVFAVMSQINDQLGGAPDLDTFLKVVVGVIKDLTQFHRVMVYQFDETWNGQVVAELVDWKLDNGPAGDLYKGLLFPASDIPKQARELYATNKVRLLYNRDQTTARIVVRSFEDLEVPLDMTHCYLRAMSPIHIKYLGNMGVRASMSISIMAFGQLWGLVACHTYGAHGMRVSLPVRQMLRSLSQSISKHIERLIYEQRLHIRKLINKTVSSNPTPIMSNADELLGLFGADFGAVVIGEDAKMLGPNDHGQEILMTAAYFAQKQFATIQVSHCVAVDFPDQHLITGLEVVAGLLYVPLSSSGKDFVLFLRKGEQRHVHWAGNPYKGGPGANDRAVLEPRKNFRVWSETLTGRSKPWSDEQLESAGYLASVIGKFIEVWREKETALQADKLASLLWLNASHEVRTPLNHIINYLEMALNGPLDAETRDNLSRSHKASKGLLFTINDLLDLTRMESGNETSFIESFHLPSAIEEATYSFQHEAERRGIIFKLDIADSPKMVVGDSKKIRSVIQNLTENALGYTKTGTITVRCALYVKSDFRHGPEQEVVEFAVADTGCGIAPLKLESIFREFEHVSTSERKTSQDSGVGQGLAVVGRIVEQLGGQLRVQSDVGKGSRFSFLIPLSITVEPPPLLSKKLSLASIRVTPPAAVLGEIKSLVTALAASHITPLSLSARSTTRSPTPDGSHPRITARPLSESPVPDSGMLQAANAPVAVQTAEQKTSSGLPSMNKISSPSIRASPLGLPLPSVSLDTAKLRVLVVEDNLINSTILAKRMRKLGHTVVITTNGQSGLDKIISDNAFDCVLMDIQMPILGGFEATEKIRAAEISPDFHSAVERLSYQLNGRIPIFAVSASLVEKQRERLLSCGVDGWMLKPIDHARLNAILKGVTDPTQRQSDLYYPGCSWERGGWLVERSNQTFLVGQG